MGVGTTGRPCRAVPLLLLVLLYCEAVRAVLPTWSRSKSVRADAPTSGSRHGTPLRDMVRYATDVERARTSDASASHLGATPSPARSSSASASSSSSLPEVWRPHLPPEVAHDGGQATTSGRVGTHRLVLTHLAPDRPPYMEPFSRQWPEWHRVYAHGKQDLDETQQRVKQAHSEASKLAALQRQGKAQPNPRAPAASELASHAKNLHKYGEEISDLYKSQLRDTQHLADLQSRPGAGRGKAWAKMLLPPGVTGPSFSAAKFASRESKCMRWHLEYNCVARNLEPHLRRAGILAHSATPTHPLSADLPREPRVVTAHHNDVVAMAHAVSKYREVTPGYRSQPNRAPAALRTSFWRSHRVDGRGGGGESPWSRGGEHDVGGSDSGSSSGRGGEWSSSSLGHQGHQGRGGGGGLGRSGLFSSMGEGSSGGSQEGSSSSRHHRTAHRPSTDWPGSSSATSPPRFSNASPRASPMRMPRRWASSGSSSSESGEEFAFATARAGGGSRPATRSPSRSPSRHVSWAPPLEQRTAAEGGGAAGGGSSRTTSPHRWANVRPSPLPMPSLTSSPPRSSTVSSHDDFSFSSHSPPRRSYDGRGGLVLGHARASPGRDAPTTSQQPPSSQAVQNPAYREWKAMWDTRKLEKALAGTSIDSPKRPQ